MSTGKHTTRHLRPHVWRARWRARWAGLLILPTMFMTKAPVVLHTSTDSSGNLPRVAPSWSVPGETRARLTALKRSRAERRRLAAEARARAATKRERERRERERVQRIEERRESRVQTVLRRARQLLGVPYRWGGASSSGLDCSGFTMLAFRAAGIELPHASWLQPRYGVRVSDPRPGDLVKWPWNHVAIYLGGGQVIGAHRRGVASSISPIYGSPSFYRLVS